MASGGGYRCPHCDARFVRKEELGGHLSKGVTCASSLSRQTIMLVVDSPESSPQNLLQNSPRNSSQISLPNAAPRGNHIAPMHELLQRATHEFAQHRVVEVGLVRTAVSNNNRTFKLHEVKGKPVHTSNFIAVYCCFVLLADAGCVRRIPPRSPLALFEQFLARFLVCVRPACRDY